MDVGHLSQHCWHSSKIFTHFLFPFIPTGRGLLDKPNHSFIFHGGSYDGLRSYIPGCKHTVWPAVVRGKKMKVLCLYLWASQTMQSDVEYLILVTFVCLLRSLTFCIQRCISYFWGVFKQIWCQPYIQIRQVTKQSTFSCLACTMLNFVGRKSPYQPPEKTDGKEINYGVEKVYEFWWCTSCRHAL